MISLRYVYDFQVIPAKKIRPRPVPKPAPVQKEVAWDIPAIQCYEPDDGVFYAQMGPTGGKHGYSAITGQFLYIEHFLLASCTAVQTKCEYHKRKCAFNDVQL